MLHVYDTNNDDNSGHPKPSRKNQLNCHGIFVTSEDLNNSLQTLSSSVGSQKIYLKPLPNENDMLNSRLLNDDKKRLPKAERSALLPFSCDVDCSTPSPPLSTRSTHNNDNYLELFASQPTNTAATLQRNSSYSPSDSKNYTIKYTSNSTHSTITPINEQENDRQSSQHRKPHRQRRQHHHENRSSFHRHSVLRQSLGGINVLTYHTNALHQDSSEPDNEISPKSYDSNVEDIRKCTAKRVDSKFIDYLSSSASSIHTNSSSKSLKNSNHCHHRHNDDVDDYQLKTFRLSNLPSWDHLNYALKPFTSNHHGSETKFKGFRLVHKAIQSEYCLPRVHISSYNNNKNSIPFQLNDIIVSVNNHKLSTMSEAEALQYVYNAFKDAQHYTIDVDILRSSRKSFNNESSSTLLKQSLITRQKSDSGYSNSIEVNIPKNPHRPRRRREGECKNYSSCEITSERSPYKNDKKEQKDRTLLIRNTNRTNLSRLSLMDYPDSPNVCLKSRQMSAVDSVSHNSSDNNHGVVDYDDRINTATFASSLCSSNLADSGFVTIRRPKQPSRLTIINSDSGDVANNRFSLTSAGLLSSLDNSNNKAKNSPKVDTIDNRHLDNNRSNSRTLTPHTTEVTSPCIPRRSLNMSSKDPNAFNTRTIGQTMHIQLTKMLTTGLGFTLTSRDTQTQSSQMSDPVYVKKILPDGAAIQDGRLLAGDRLLAIDGEEVRSLNQVLSQLRSLTPGKQVDLLISRQISCDLDSNTRKSSQKHLPPRPFMTCTFEYQLPLDTTTNQSDTIKGPPVLGINFKWSNDILTSPLLSSSPSSPQTVTTKSITRPASPSQYSSIPGLYVDSLLPDTLVTSSNHVTVKTGDRLVAINGESVDGMNAKTIVNKLKNVIKQCHEQNISNSDQSSASFTLTVHRYKNQNDRRSSVGDTLKLTSVHPPSCRHIKTIRGEAVEKGHPGRHEHSKLNSPADSQDTCSLSFTLNDSRRRLLHRSDSISSEIGSHILHHDYHGDSHSHLSSQRSDIHEDNHLLSTESLLKVNYPTSRNLSVPSNRNFLRDGFGRRSVSEKRHGHVDASQYSFFQTNILPNRYKMPEDVDKQYSTMPTTRRLKMHKARLAAVAANVDSYSSIGGGGLIFNNSTSCTSSGPLKALHPLDNVLPQSLSNTSYRDPEEIDIESQLDQPPILRNRKQNTSFRHAVDRSFYPTSTTTTTAADTTTAYYNSFDTNASPSSSAPPIPPHRPRSESGTRDKLSNNPQHKNSSKTKNSNPLPEKSTGSILFSSSPSVYKTIDKLERAHSKPRPEIHLNNSVLVKDSKSSSHSISNNNLPTEQKHSKSGRISLKNLFRIGNSKTESELNGDYLLHNSNQSKPISETSTILSKKQLRRLSVPEYQSTNNLLTSTKLIDKIHEKNSYNNYTSTTTTTSTIPSVQQIFNHSSSQSKLSNTTHYMDCNVICNDSMYKTISPNIMTNNNHNNYKTISVNHPYCPPPDISPPPLPPRVSYTTPPILTMKSNNSKMIKYRPLPEERSNNDPRMIDETRQNRRKKSSYSMTTSVISSHSTTHQSKSSPKITSTASSPTYCLALNTVDPTVLSTSIKKSNFGHDDNNALVTNDNSRSRRRRHHHHYEHHKNSNQQDGILSESSTKSQTPAIYMNSKQIDKDYKKSTPSPHRSRSTHARLPLNKSQHNNHDNITTTTTNTVATIMSTTNSPESIHYYQAPLISSHSAMSTPRRHRRLQDGRKSEYHINNRKQQITMQEASLIVSFPMDKLITPKHSSIHHQH
ncbi:unnamed protein product [Schistosoma guineensis]|nr:unnamed protein product [Schistosoma guineensis]